MVAGQIRLSMLRGAHGAPQPSDIGEAARGRRTRVFVGCAALTLVLHVALLDGLGGWTARPFDVAPATVHVRAIAAAPPSPTLVSEPPPPTPDDPKPALPAPDVRPAAAALLERQRVRPPPARAAAPKFAVPEHSPANAEVSAGSAELGQMTATTVSSLAASPIESPATARAAAPDLVAADSTQSPGPGGSPGANPAPAAAIPGMGDRPPPVYEARLPPAATLHYQVRRGFLRGDGQIRWRPAGNAYHLVLEASVAGLTLLVQTSDGAIDHLGLQPVRFLDQRARRSAQAANFVRERGRVTFSGTAIEWPLVAGVQDRLSWMIQLAGIVAADPALLHEGSRITMAVVGARGDADVWSLRYAGEERVETPSGGVAAFKLHREGHSPNETTAEVWLDPARSYLPVRATLGNGSGAPEYDLLLDRVDP